MRPFWGILLTSVVRVLVAGTSSFTPPVWEETNLMVFGAGGYRLTDHLRVTRRCSHYQDRWDRGDRAPVGLGTGRRGSPSCRGL